MAKSVTSDVIKLHKRKCARESHAGTAMRLGLDVFEFRCGVDAVRCAAVIQKQAAIERYDILDVQPILASRAASDGNRCTAGLGQFLNL